jgi:hypothetical protein
MPQESHEVDWSLIVMLVLLIGALVALMSGLY